MSPKDIEDVRIANKETRKFFFYICQYMFVYMIYACVKSASYYFIDTKNINDYIISSRIIDTIDVIL
jgi:hypothetical protein